MKQLVLGLTLTLISLAATAGSDEPFTWPVKGKPAGSDILYNPGSYIDGEQNYGNLFIGTTEGDEIIAPADGVVFFASLTYYQSLTYGNTIGFDSRLSFDQVIAQEAANPKMQRNPKFLNGNISIKLADGRKIHISGLRGNKTYKTGQVIKRGEVLGTAGYCYRKISQSSIRVSMSAPNDQQLDPMTPLGIRSTFVKAASTILPETLTKEQAIEDYTIYMSALKEAFPGLYKLGDTTHIEQYFNRQLNQLDTTSRPITYNTFASIIEVSNMKLHDSHLAVILPAEAMAKMEFPKSQPQIFVGIFGDSIICTNATKQYTHLIARRVSWMNGYTADSAINYLRKYTDGYDAQVESYPNFHLSTLAFGQLYHEKRYNNWDTDIKFTDGTKLSIKGHPYPAWVNNWIKYRSINQQSIINTRRINDSVAYLGLATFDLDQMTVERIRRFVDSIKSYPNLIVDLRNNSGGSKDVSEEVFSLFARDTLRLEGFNRVYKTGSFPTFKYSNNYLADQEIFPTYTPIEGRKGYFENGKTGDTYAPDSSIHYDGRIYVLTNEQSASASGLLASLIVRSGRGVSVGRETRSAYHFMHALKKAEMRLPNSQIMVIVPLVEIVFDTLVNDRFPYGRGLMADYPVDFSLGELYYDKTDTIFNHALKLITLDRYLSTTKAAHHMQSLNKSHLLQAARSECPWRNAPKINLPAPTKKRR